MKLETKPSDDSIKGLAFEAIESDFVERLDHLSNLASDPFDKSCGYTQQTKITGDFHQEDGRNVLLPAIIGGIALGLTADILIVVSNYGFWLGLLGHSVFGAIGFGLVFTLSLHASKKASCAKL